MQYSFQQGLLNMPPKRDPDRRLLLLPLEQIRTAPGRARKSIDRAALSELMVSIAQIGLIEPVIVRRQQDGYELIAGERRFRACRLLGYKEIPCIVIQAGEEKCAVMALSENLQRRPLHFLEEAERLSALLKKGAMTEEQLTTMLGKNDPYLSNRLRLLKLPQETRARLRTSGLSERHARSLLRIPDSERQQQALDLIERPVHQQRQKLYRSAGGLRRHRGDGGDPPRRRRRSSDPRSDVKKNAPDGAIREACTARGTSPAGALPRACRAGSKGTQALRPRSDRISDCF